MHTIGVRSCFLLNCGYADCQSRPRYAPQTVIACRILDSALDRTVAHPRSFPLAGSNDAALTLSRRIHALPREVVLLFRFSE